MAAENQLMAGKAGAIKAVVAAMRIHAGNGRVLETACWAIVGLSLKNGAFMVWLCMLF